MTIDRKSKSSYLLIDVIVLLATPLIAALLVVTLSLNLMASTLLFFGPAALYLSCRKRAIIIPSLVYATATAIISIMTDYLAERDQAWVSTSMFQLRIAKSVPAEALVWLFLLTYLILAYYLFFYGTLPRKAIGRRTPPVFFTAGIILVWLGLTTVTDVHFTVDYFYIKSGVLFLVIPLVAFIVSFPRYLRVLLKITPYFFALGLINLLVSLHMGHWSYPGHHFVGHVKVGSYRFPVEELLFWIILYAPFVTSQFEFFTNDRLKIRAFKLR